MARKSAPAAAPSAAKIIEDELRNHDALAQAEIDAGKALAACRAELLRLSPKATDPELRLAIAKRLDPNALVGQPKCSPDAAAIAARQAVKAK